jgi:hypothetical protein
MAIQYFHDRKKFTIGLQEERVMSQDQANAMRHERNLLKNTAALEPGPLDGIDYTLFGNAGHAPGILLRSFLSKDAEWHRAHMPVLDRDLASIASGHGRLDKSLSEIGRIFEDKDLSPEGRTKRASDVFEVLLAVVEHWLTTKTKETINKLEAAEELFRLAEKPLPNPDEDAAVKELRRSEVRAWFFGLSEPSQGEALERFGREARLEQLAAVQNDPCGRLRVSRLIVDSARIAAVRAQGGDFILVELMDARDMIDALKWRASGLSRLLRGWAADRGLKLAEGTNAFELLATEALARSEEFLRVVEDR